MKKFNFWIPITKAVGENKQDDEEMILEGIASTSREDLDGEFLDPSGFDLSYFNESGLVNYHHQSTQSPASIIGEPIESRITPEGMYVKVKLYKDNPLAREVYESTKLLQNSSKKRRMGFSIEGQAQERDSKNPKRINRAKITGLAITFAPKNSDTFAEIVKGLQITKTVSTEGIGKPLKKESLNKHLKISEVYKSIFSTFLGISLSKAKKVFELIKSINNKGMITEEAIQKAFEALGVSKEISKGADGKKMKKESTYDEDDDLYDKDHDESEDDEDDEEMMKGKGKLKKSLSDDDSEITKAEYQRMKAACEAYENKSKKIQKSVGGDTDLILKSLRKIQKQLQEQREEIEEIKSTPSVGRKSIFKGVKIEKFDDDNLEKGVDNEKVINISDIRKTRETLDHLTFHKGFNQDFGNALQYFDANKTLPDFIIGKIQQEGYKIKR